MTKAQLTTANQRLLKQLAAFKRATAKRATRSQDVKVLRAALLEAEQRQGATSEILRVISSSHTDLQPVFDGILENATRLCDAHIGLLGLYDGQSYRTVGFRGANADFVEWLTSKGAYVLSPDTGIGRMIARRQPIHIPDYLESPGYRNRSPRAVAIARLGKVRTYLAVPMLKEGCVVGGITIYRPEVRPFTQKQIDLVSTFANQAVIAIENVRLFNETKEALERQTATADILRVISSTPTDTQPVFDAIARNCVQLFGGMNAAVTLVRDDKVELGAFATANEVLRKEFEDFFPLPLTEESATGRAILKGDVIQVYDMQTDPLIGERVKSLAQRMGFRGMLTAPMIREGKAIGAINVQRGTPGSYTDKQIAQLKTFADQAVIAIENVRLFNETKESLERQTATAEILKVISSSLTDTQPVFDAILERATKLCEAETGMLYRYEDGAYHAQATRIPDPAFAQLYWKPRRPTPGSNTGLGRMMRERRAVHIPDLLKDDAHAEADPMRLETLKGGVRTWLGAPLLKEGELIGAIVIYRSEPRAFSEQQISLLQTFADQAVIAIENVRLFNETKEALERQTATADILRVISSSVTDTQPVFNSITDAAVRLFGRVVLWLAVNGKLKLVAAKSGPNFPDMSSQGDTIAIDRSSGIGRAVLECAPSQIRDIRDGDAELATARGLAERYGWRASLCVPMLREGRAIGGIAVVRAEPGLFSDKEIALLQTFADQAVIAIENVRLFNELQTRTEALSRSVGQLTALGEVGQAISSTLDLETVLKTIVSRALQLTGLDAGVIYEYDEPTGQFQLRASEDFDEQSVIGLRGAGLRKGEGAVGVSVVTREPTQAPDTHAPDYPVRLRELLDRAGFRAVLAVPLLREDHIIGALMMLRKAPGPFAPEIVELLKSFASQSALAIQNARLFREIAEKGKQLEVASRHKSDFLSSMSHELRTPLNSILGFNEMLLGEVYGEVPADMQAPLAQIQTSGKQLLRLINNVLDLAKIEAGRMELSLQDYSVHDTVESVRSTLRSLAADKGLEFFATLPEDLPLAYGDAGRITQCLMNLAGNSLKFTKAGKVEISVEARGDLLVFKVADTGIGIPPDKIGSLFTEFKQTDVSIASEFGGTGLGLSISKKFVEMHGGRIWVESEPGKGSAFIFEIPLRASAGARA